MASEYFSLPEVAAQLGISRIAVYKRVRAGKLAAIRIGRFWAVPVSAIPAAGAKPPETPVTEGGDGDMTWD